MSTRFTEWLFGWFECTLSMLFNTGFLFISYVLARHFKIVGPIPFLEEGKNWFMAHRTEIDIALGVMLTLCLIMVIIGIKQLRKQQQKQHSEELKR